MLEILKNCHVECLNMDYVIFLVLINMSQKPSMFVKSLEISFISGMVKIYIFFMHTLKLSQECQLLNTNIDCLNKF